MMNADLLKGALSDMREAVDVISFVNLSEGAQEDARGKVLEADALLSNALAKMRKARA